MYFIGIVRDRPAEKTVGGKGCIPFEGVSPLALYI